VGPPELPRTGGPIEPPVNHRPEPVSSRSLFPVKPNKSPPRLPAVIEAAFSGSPSLRERTWCQPHRGAVATERSRTWPHAAGR
jgi:hypothetical protein